MKKEIVHKKGIDLVVVPCWWSGDKERYERIMINFFLIIFLYSV